MNVQFYVGRFDEASWHFLAQIGLAPGRLRDERKGLVALEQVTKYKLEVLAGSLLHIRTELLEISNKTLRYRHTMFNSETEREVATMELLVAYFDMEARKAAPIPDASRTLANNMLAAA